MESRPKLTELRPDRALLNPDFDGYKLSLTPISTITEEVEIPVDRLVPTANEYSLLHAKLFIMQNHLIGECDDTEFVYFVDKSWNVRKFSIAENANQFLSELLWQIPKRRDRHSGDYNVSVKLPTESLAVVSDGMGFIYILDRGSRSTNQHWKVSFSSEVVPDRSFTVTEARCHDNRLHLLLLSIAEVDSKHISRINWVTLEQNGESWNQTVLRELVVKGFVQYSCLDDKCEAVLVCSEAGCKFTLDSEREIVSETEAQPPNLNQQDEAVAADREALTGDTEATTGDSEAVTADSQAQPLDLSHLDALTSDTEVAPPSGTTFNSQQVEECDFESDQLSILERIDATNHKTTHKINLGTHKILLQVCLEQRVPLAFGVRSDVDCCIFQPGQDFTITHRGTLLALAYIQASKQQMKYFTCAPNMSYSVICESSKHVFLYRQNKAIASGELRNRVTGQRVNTLAQQQVYNMPKNEEILGVYASNFYLYVLGETFITALKL